MKQVGTVSCVVVVGAAMFITIASTLPIQTTVKEPSTNSDFFNNLNRNFEVVEGPKEFLLPLAPLKSLLARQQRKSEGGSNEKENSAGLSDLDLMVYGKVYLMKALGTQTRSAITNGGNVVSTTDKSGDDGISFPPTTKPAKRSYQYKYWNTPKPSDYKDFPESFRQSENRKIETRSAERMHDEEEGSSSSHESGTTLANSASPTAATPTPGPENDFMVLDEEAIELFKKLMPEALTIHETAGISNQSQSQQASADGAILGSDSTANHNSSNFELDDRFLINVPQKSSSQCPEGQRRTHHGTCKTVFVHRPSPRDGLFAGRLSAPVTTPNDGSEQEKRGGVHLSTLFSSFAKLSKTLEKAVREAEQKLVREGTEGKKEDAKADKEEKQA